MRYTRKRRRSTRDARNALAEQNSAATCSALMHRNGGDNGPRCRPRFRSDAERKRKPTGNKSQPCQASRSQIPREVVVFPGRASRPRLGTRRVVGDPRPSRPRRVARHPRAGAHQRLLFDKATEVRPPACGHHALNTLSRQPGRRQRRKPGRSRTPAAVRRADVSRSIDTTRTPGLDVLDLAASSEAHDRQRTALAPSRPATR